jgi:AAA+ ATPase superfamily predicted ATPase
VHFQDPETPASPSFTYDNWDLALRQVALMAQQRRIVVFIDEVTYLIDVNPNIIGTFQKAWDHWLSDSNVMLALSGSQMNLMRENLLMHDAPLYGRADVQLKLLPLPFAYSSEFFPEYDAASRVALFSIWGGIPAYWERLSPDKSVLQNLRQQLFSWMVDEPKLLLQDFLSDPHNYVSIMRAIAEGQQALGEISERTGLSGKHTSFYLSVLRDTGFVERRVPVTQQAKRSRRGRYLVTDPYLRFYYRYLAAYQSKLAMGEEWQVMQDIEESLPSFIEANTWLELCQEWTLQASAKDELPVPVEEVGSEWKRNLMVDVAGISKGDRTMVLGDCYWRNRPVGAEAIDELLDKTRRLLPQEGSWTIYYVLFSKSGWTDEAKVRAEKLAKRGRKKWKTAGVRLVDLEEVDADLARWAGVERTERAVQGALLLD